MAKEMSGAGWWVVVGILCLLTVLILWTVIPQRLPDQRVVMTLQPNQPGCAVLLPGGKWQRIEQLPVAADRTVHFNAGTLITGECVGSVR